LLQESLNRRLVPAAEASQFLGLRQIAAINHPIHSPRRNTEENSQRRKVKVTGAFVHELHSKVTDATHASQRDVSVYPQTAMRDATTRSRKMSTAHIFL
jgi:hypothetical protein